MREYLKKRNLSMLCDFYEFTMSSSYLKSGMQNKIVCFDMFFRKIPDNGGFVIFAGLEQVIEYIKSMHFSDDDISYLRENGVDNEEFLKYLRHFKFSCDIWSVPEGTVVFPNEPIITVRGPIIEAQLIETMLLLCINHQSLITSKASRIVRAAKGKSVFELGARRAQGFDAAVLGARAAYIAGVDASSCALSAQLLDIACVGTMAHSWVQLFDNEYEAFSAYARAYPHDCTLLVDTYNTLRSGIPNAIKTFDNILKPQGIRPKGIRIDSGDITYLSKKARKMLDEAGYPDCKIIASNSLDEHIISDMIAQGALVDCYGVGERLITSKSEPVFGGVYKLTAVEQNGEYIPKIKLSENTSKITTPGFKRLYRLFDRENGKALADVIALFDELVDDSGEYEIFDPDFIWKKKTLRNFKAVDLRKQIFNKGNLCYDIPSIEDIRRNCKENLNSLWDEVKRFENPHKYYVDLTQKLWNTKSELIKFASKI